MNLFSAQSLEAVVIFLGGSATITTEPAPGDENRWFVLQNGYVLPGLHILKKGERYVFGTITP